MKINIIAAVSDNGIIGVNGELPWIIPEDLAKFKMLTTLNSSPEDNIIVMGWKTWESLGEKPLPNRMNVILSRRDRKVPRNRLVKVIHSMNELEQFGNRTINIIGGETVYRYFLPIADMLYITHVYTKVETKKGDRIVKMPEFSTKDWKVIETDPYFNEPIDYCFVTYARK